MQTFIGMVTFGNLDFTKLAYRSIQETVVSKYKFCIVIGKPNDGDTARWASQNGIPHIVHTYNKGFPASINDLYDWGFKNLEYDAFVAIGNDVIAYPYAIDNLISVAKNTNYEWVCAKEVSVKTLCNAYPEVKEYFQGGDYIFSNFDSRPWEVFNRYSKEIKTSVGGLSDVHNLALYKKSVFDKIGYVDVNFYPAYYEDNDYARRGILANISSCTVDTAYYFHFWSRTIKQGSGGSTNKFFNMNKRFYETKYGGDFKKERWDIPFNNQPHELVPGIILEPTININNRDNEEEIINYWRGK